MGLNFAFSHNSMDVRVVKESDLSSDGPSPQEFEPPSMYFFIHRGSVSSQYKDLKELRVFIRS